MMPKGGTTTTCPRKLGGTGLRKRGGEESVKRIIQEPFPLDEGLWSEKYFLLQIANEEDRYFDRKIYLTILW